MALEKDRAGGQVLPHHYRPLDFHDSEGAIPPVESLLRDSRTRTYAPPVQDRPRLLQPRLVPDEQLQLPHQVQPPRLQHLPTRRRRLPNSLQNPQAPLHQKNHLQTHSLHTRPQSKNRQISKPNRYPQAKLRQRPILKVLRYGWIGTAVLVVDE